MQALHVHELLPAGARPAIEKALARPLSYTAAYVVAPGPRPRAVVVLGEAHIKLAEAAELGKGVVSRFELRGVETFQRKQVVLGTLLGVLIQAPRTLLRVATFGLVKGSTITEAKALDHGHTADLEPTSDVPLALHVASVYLTVLFSVLYATAILNLLGVFVPWLVAAAALLQLHLLALVPAYLLRREPWAWLIHPAVGLVTVRDALMADGTVRMLREHPDPEAAVVVMGRAHVPGYVRELVERHGFQRAEL
ncbi:MAG: hypothetical protein KIT84_28400 [Labilithrix sp.]|nr:hypothetical protein [Labilithrix sp.]MCW5814981.1 hypothetical protein [Labilithrix sp.]